jgi:hypothetical protein
VLWGALLVASVIAIIFVSAYAIFPIGLLLGLQHPQFSEFAFTVNPSGVTSIPVGSGNITGLFEVTSNNPVGVAVGNPVNLTVIIELPINGSADTNIHGIFFIPQVSIPTNSKHLSYLLESQQTSTLLRPVKYGQGFVYSGSVGIIFYGTGLVGGTLNFESLVNNGTGVAAQYVDIPPTIQVQPEIATEQFATDEIVVSLDLVVIALIIFELYSDYRKRERTNDPNSSSLIKRVNRGEYD